MKRPFLGLTCLAVLIAATVFSTPSADDLREARRLRADAAYREMTGDVERAIELYERSLGFLHDDAIVAKIAELRGSPEETDPAHGLPMGVFIPLLFDFRDTAVAAPDLAFGWHVDREVRNLLRQWGREFSLSGEPRLEWSYFFRTSLAAITSLSEDAVLAMFYHPWSDAALLTEWRRTESGPEIVQAELVAGTVIRQDPDIMPIARWRSETLPPILSIPLVSSGTLASFMERFGARPDGARPDWRDILYGVHAVHAIEDHRALAALLIAHSVAAIQDLMANPQVAPMRHAWQEVWTQLEEGQFEEVLQRCTDLPQDLKESLAGLAPDWADATVVSFAGNARNSFVFLAPSHAPSQPACFWFAQEGPDSPATLKRVDFMDLAMTPDEVALLIPTGIREVLP